MDSSLTVTQAVVHPFLLLQDLSYTCTTMYSTMLLLMKIWVVSVGAIVYNVALKILEHVF